MAVQKLAHPAQGRLRAFGMGGLDDAEAAAIEEHIGSCDTCRRFLEGLPNDSFAARVKSAAETVGPEAGPRRDTVSWAAQQGQVGTKTEPPTPPKKPELGLPEDFGRYRILKQIGVGGMGAVYQARDRQLDRDVALKVPRLFPDDHPDVLQRFYREARAAATFNHPNLCQVYEVGEHQGIHYLTMPFIKGLSLAKYLDKTGPLPQRQAAALVRKLALAMQEAHVKRVIHRDLKPGNIMINQRSEPVIMDFGLARRDQAADERLTHSGAVMGTPAYMPPEQVSGDQKAIGPGTDIYSMGVIMYELLTGRLPFEGSAAVQMGMVMTQEPPTPSQLRPDLDAQLEAICQRAMRKKPADRYPSMKAFADDLTAYLKAKAPSTGGAGKTREADGLPFDELADDPNQRAFSPASPQSRSLWSKVPGEPWLIAAAGAAALLLAGIVIIIRTPDGKTTRLESDDPSLKATIELGAGADKTVISVSNPAAAGTAAVDGFVPLFNGNDLTGWKKYFTDNQDWAVENGELVGRSRWARSFGGFLATERTDYRDFHLRCETKLADGYHSLLLFRFQPSAEPGQASGCGVYLPGAEEERLASQATAGTLCSFQHGKPIGIINRGPTKLTVRRDDWFKLEVIARGSTLKVLVNGEVVMETSDNTYQTGAVGIHCAPAGSTVRFRKIEIKELPPAPPAPAPAAPRDAGFVPLFNGKDLTGWKVDSGDPNAWAVPEGEIVVIANPKNRGWLLTEKEYGDAILRLQFQLSAEANSGVAFRARPGNIPEIQVLDDSAPRYRGEQRTKRTGALHNTAIDQAAQLKPVGEWNDLEIEVRGQTLRVAVNGKQTLSTQLGNNVSGTGCFGLQNWDGVVRFRKIEIEELPPGQPPTPAAQPAPTDEWVSLFNGKDFTHWKLPANPKPWKIENGQLVGRGDPRSYLSSFLRSERNDYENFHFRIEARINAGGYSGQYFRVKPGGGSAGYEAEINSSNGRHYVATPGLKNGTLFKYPKPAGNSTGAVAPVRNAVAPPDTWFTQEVIAKGNHITILVNGKTVVDYVDQKTPALRGGLALEIIVPESVVKFRKIEIKELPPASR